VDEARCIVTPDVRFEPFAWSNGRLTIEGAFQLDTVTSHIYHEVLVSLPLMCVASKWPVENVLILGGGDGCSAAEALKFGPKRVVIVDWNRRLVEFCAAHPDLCKLNRDAYNDPRVEVVFGDAYEYVSRHKDEKFDVVILDFTATDGEARIDSKEFHTNIRRIALQSAWSRVLDFPLHKLPWWIDSNTIVFDVDYPLDRMGLDTPMGESFIMCIPTTDYCPDLLGKMRYLTKTHMDAIKNMDAANSKDQTARGVFASS